MNIYVGNLSYETTDEELREAFEAFGAVNDAKVIMDKISGRSRGFGFVEMAEKEEGEAAINGLNGKELRGRTLRINEAQPRPANKGRDTRGRTHDRAGMSMR